MKPTAWYDPSNGVVSTDKDCPLYTPLGQVWALYPQPEQEALYGMNQDDWKDVVAAITKVRDGRGIYLACRPADVFQGWFLALGTAKVKEINT